MFRKNKRTQQPLLLTDLAQLPARSRTFLEKSWAHTFRQEVFLRIDETPFAGLYDDGPSRPNEPVNVFVALDILKHWRGWSDEELYEHFLFDLQVRYAVGCDRWDEANFDLRTLYYFRQRVSAYGLKTGQNLFQTVFQQVTDQQLEKLALKTGMQRMDSTQLASNIADLSRLELLVRLMQRVQAVLSPTDQAHFAELFAPYLREGAGQYVYRIKGKDETRAQLQRTGVQLHHLLTTLGEAYAAEPLWAVARRFFEENFKLVEQAVHTKTNAEITAGCLQSLDDLEATYRCKANQAYKGHVANVSETCDPTNPVQLIDLVQVAPNQISDIQLLKDAVPELTERLQTEHLITDGGYVSPEIDVLLHAQGITQLPTNLVGTGPDHTDGHLAVSDFALQLDAQDTLSQCHCPAQHTATISATPSGKTYRLIFEAATCLACPHSQRHQCPVRLNKRQTRARLSLPQERVLSAVRRQRFETHKAAARKLRPAIEATMFHLQIGFPKGRLRLRGLLRVTCAVVCAALAVNLRRIHRYQRTQAKAIAEKASPEAASDRADSFFRRLWIALIGSLTPFQTCFGC
jgi:hypothetical protein